MRSFVSQRHLASPNAHTHKVHALPMLIFFQLASDFDGGECAGVAGVGIGAYALTNSFAPQAAQLVYFGENLPHFFLRDFKLKCCSGIGARQHLMGGAGIRVL
jgi:hypothetical protein